MKKILVLGASGMLGSMTAKVLISDNTHLIGLSARKREDLCPDSQNKIATDNLHIIDVVNFSSNQLAELISKYDWVINCIGVTKPNIQESSQPSIENAYLVNTKFPQHLARVATNQPVQILQIATDCVYTGSRGSYCEYDQHDGPDIYAQSKSLGEIQTDKFYNLRCSIIGPEPNDENNYLLGWFKHQPSQAKLNGFTHHLWNGVSTYHFAKVALGIITREIPMPNLQHLVPSDLVNKYQLLQMMQEIYARSDLEITPVTGESPVNRTLATANQELNLQLWQAAGFKSVPSIRQMLEQLIELKL